MSTDVSLNLGTQFQTPANGIDSLRVALIGPDSERRWAMSKALADSGRANVREFHSYPKGSQDFKPLLEQSFDVFIIDLDSDADVALELVESVEASGVAEVMVYSQKADTKLAVNFMRAGAREYLLLPLEQGILDEALTRVPANARDRAHPGEKTHGGLLVFLGAKGGSGVTTVACNLAVALARESDQTTLLIDLAAPIGDAALTLGLSPDYSTEDALRNVGRLDASLLDQLVARHSSGLFVLAAPSKVPEVEASKYAIDKLVSIARTKFDHVIVDVGSRIDMADTALFKDASTIYLVTLTGISDLRNASRVISQFFTEGSPKLEIVVNRFEPRLLGGVGEQDVTKALERPVRWKIPDDHDAAREINGDSAQARTRIARITTEMASAITGHPVSQEKEKKKSFDFKGFGRSIAQKVSRHEDSPAISIAPSASARPSPTMSIVPPAIPRPASANTIAPPAAERTAPVIAIVPPAAPRPAPPVVPPSDGRATATITWPAPGLIAYGDPLTSVQLNATSSLTGSLVYTPGPGYALPAGTHTLTVTFTPADSQHYASSQATVSLKVAKARPSVKWSNPNPITHGMLLSVTELCAAASVPGNFDYSPELGKVLSAGRHTISATFTPTDSVNYATAQISASLDVERATPLINWPNPDPIPCGDPLTSAQLSATASVPGTFDYSPAPNQVLPPGTQTLSLTFTPTDSANYAKARATVSIYIARAKAAISWSIPHSIAYGTLLGESELCATSPVPGTFDYTPAPGKVLAAGTHPLSAVFTPADGENYSRSEASVSLEVIKAAPVLTWTNPEPIQFGSALGETELCATASVPGAFVYSPPAGEKLPPGTHTLSVTFTPTDATNYAQTEASVSIEVARATPVITWSSPEPIPYGTPLSGTQLCATASVVGKFADSPALGKVLPAGTQTLSVIFSPTDSANYTTAQASVSLEVTKAAPVITWSNPASITFGALLTAAQFCARASVQGSFEYSPAPGNMLPAGKHKLSVIFTPDDSVNYAATEASVWLEVSRATPVLDWPKPDPIKYGALLSILELCATASVEGSFAYSPGLGEVLPPGSQPLSVSFTPADSANYAVTQATISLQVAGPHSLVASPGSDSIQYDAALGTPQLRANLSVPANVAFPPAAAYALSPEKLIDIPSSTDASALSPRSPNSDYSASTNSGRPEGAGKRPPAAPRPRETRVYKGALYEKGEDGQWHLHQK